MCFSRFHPYIIFNSCSHVLNYDSEYDSLNEDMTRLTSREQQGVGVLRLCIPKFHLSKDIYTSYDNRPNKVILQMRISSNVSRGVMRLVA